MPLSLASVGGKNLEKILIHENLSPSLESRAHERGFGGFIWARATEGLEAQSDL